MSYDEKFGQIISIMREKFAQIMEMLREKKYGQISEFILSQSVEFNKFNIVGTVNEIELFSQFIHDIKNKLFSINLCLEVEEYGQINDIYKKTLELLSIFESIINYDFNEDFISKIAHNNKDVLVQNIKKLEKHHFLILYCSMLLLPNNINIEINKNDIKFKPLNYIFLRDHNKIWKYVQSIICKTFKINVANKDNEVMVTFNSIY